ncbi:acyl-CoA carboxylase subunit epsilon [Dietzia sp. PP-33]|uniref:acyl-CoA carboxylase subunit epsilon n=1 Tax=Dietzia sp. PP-33 TaxID=2957500 RepID=UPI0029A8CC92|nr:acyl-CoA carboxylase subunit epsilon [Dietzia sp. PP-33]MDX2356697.1 acyl-CoA carboxylase subunit epsilon [Dietzia sp. PP-33]
MTAAEKQPDGEKPAAPFFEVVRGNPTAVEVGVLSAVLATAQGNAVHEGESPTDIKDDWGSYEERLRPPFGYNPTSFLNRRQY